MASWERDHTTEPVLHQLAFDIETSQLQQIGRMQGWLALWGASALPTGGHMAWMAEAPGHGHAADDPSGAVATMPGMASPEQLRALRRRPARSSTCCSCSSCCATTRAGRRCSATRPSTPRCRRCATSRRKCSARRRARATTSASS